MSRKTQLVRPLTDEEKSDVERHMLLVYKTASRAFKRGSVPYEVCLSGAMLGMMDAVQRYDTKDERFVSAAAIRMRGQITEDARSKHFRWFNPGGAGGTIGQKRRTQRPPMMATDLFDERSGQHGRECAQVYARIDNSLPEGALSGDQEFERLIRLDPPLSRTERMAMRMYFMDDITMKEIGKAIGVCDSRVCQIINQVLGRIEGRLADERRRETVTGCL